jgi:hypothetical protein
MGVTCWKPKDKNTRSEYVILIAFPRQQWLRERATMLPDTYSACLVLSKDPECPSTVPYLGNTKRLFHVGKSADA